MVDVDDILDAIRANGFETDQDTRALIMLNAAQRDIVGEHRYRFMLEDQTVPAVAGTATYSPTYSPAMQHLESIRLAVTGQTDSPELEWLPTEELLELAASNTLNTGFQAPCYWTDVDSDTFQVYPAPSRPGMFTVRYLRPPAELTSGTSVPDIPNPYWDCLVSAVCEELAVRENDLARADRFAAKREARVKAMQRQLGLRQRQSSYRVVESGAHTYRRH